MARRPLIRVPGRGAGRSIPSGSVVGRASAGRGQPEVLDLAGLKALGLAGVRAVQSQIADLLATVSQQAKIPGPPGEDGNDGERGPPGGKGDTGAAGAAGTPAVGQRLVVQSRSSSFGVNGGPSAVTLASVPVQGHLLVAVVAQHQANGAPAAGTGWTLDSSFTASFGVYYAVYYKYAGASEITSQQPQVQTLDYAGMTVWELSGVSGTWAIDKVNVAFNDNTTVATSFTDAGYSTTAGGSLVLALIVGDNAIGYAVPTIMVQVGSGTLTPDDHVGATGGLDGSSIVAGHYTLVTASGTALKESTSSANSSHWGSIYVEMASIGAAGPPGATGATGAAGAQGSAGPPGFDGSDGEDGQRGPPGAKGDAGQQGPMGFGLDGSDGEDGLIGPPGLTGATGATGSAGAPGATGAQGPIGFGLAGEDGEDGQRGGLGATGSIGAQGPMGFGLSGEDGDDGMRGPPGVAVQAASSPLSMFVYAEDQRQEDYPNFPPGQLNPEGATDSETPASPNQPTSNTVFTMAGLAGSITPKQRGLVLIIVKATVTIAGTGVIGDGLAMQIMVGTGTAPTNGAAATGTMVGNFAQRQLGANLGGAGADRSDLCCVGIVQLIPGTTYWIDVQQEQKSVNNRAQLLFPSIVAIET